VWNHDDDESKDDPDTKEDEDMDRLFAFEVAKSMEQAEDVTVRPGFNVSCINFVRMFD